MPGVGRRSLTAAQVAPGQKAKNGSANGSFSGTVNGFHMKFKLAFSKLTGPATSAYIGYGKAGKAGNVSVNLCSPCKSPVTTSVDINPSLKKFAAQHLLYVQVTTAKNPKGEIRGQLSG